LTPTPISSGTVSLAASSSQSQKGKGKAKEKSRVVSTFSTPDDVGMSLEIEDLYMYTNVFFCRRSALGGQV